MARSRSRDRSRSPKRRRRSRSRDRRSKSRERRRSKERFSGRRALDRKRSPDRRRSRERRRSRDRRSRSRDKESRRSRSRERRGDSRERKRNRSQSPSSIAAASLLNTSAADLKFDVLDKEAAQTHLDSEMQKRRERIEKWRAERRKKQLMEEKESKSAGVIAPVGLPNVPNKKWSLEDDEEEEEKEVESVPEVTKKEGEGVPEVTKKEGEEEIKMEEGESGNNKEEEEEVDPLDAFMQGINAEVRKTHGAEEVKQEKNGKVKIVMGVAKKKEVKKKAEIMEQNQDGLEYSSEEETEDLQSAVDNYNTSQLGKVKQKTTISADDFNFIPFRKNFYIEVPEIAKMTPAEVSLMRADMEGITVKGKGCPKPIKTWAQCGVSKKMLDCLKKLGLEKPTPIQAQAIPAVMSGRDLIGIAKTGSGKTLAFLIPMFRHILDQPPLEADDGPIAIIMTPTRELAMQIVKDCKKFTKALGLRAVCVYGGTGISEQIAELKRGAEIIVCTPGRMIDMLAANNGRVTNVKRCTYIVLDEADRMFDMGFEPQVMRIMDGVRPDRQTVMFSATFPRQMEALARRVLQKPIEVLVGGRSVVCREIEQNVIIIEEDKKFLKLLELLGVHQADGSAIVFVDKQENADMLLKDLMVASYSVMALHGGVDQFDRDSTIVDFKAGKFSVLVATSVAARGLDVKHCVLVVNYDCPNHYEDYVHRCGRTGRAGNKGFAYTFITPDQGKYLVDILKAFELSEIPIPEDVQKFFDDYKAQQEAEGKKVKGYSGFSGKGFKFDEAEAHHSSEKKKLQKAALGLQDSDEEDAEEQIEGDIEKMLAPKKIVKQVTLQPGQTLAQATAAAASAAASSAMNNLPIPGVGPPVQGSAQAADRLAIARMMASKINNQMAFDAKGLPGAAPGQSGIRDKPSLSLPAMAAKSLAEQRAERLHLKLGYQHRLEEEDDDDSNPLGLPQPETVEKYEEELEINDFPQQARWKVTSKEALAQISEYSEAGITVRGTYFPTGKELPEGERKLYLAIESTSERAVSKARAEIIRLLKEEMVKLQHSYQPMNKGRYRVV